MPKPGNSSAYYGDSQTPETNPFRLCFHAEWQRCCLVDLRLTNEKTNVTDQEEQDYDED
jgi:hypothetical protein